MSLTPQLKRSVKTLRAAGLEAKWSKTRKGQPIMVARNPKAHAPHMRETYWLVDRDMWEAMERDGIVEAFNNAVLLGDLFSVRV